MFTGPGRHLVLLYTYTLGTLLGLEEYLVEVPPNAAQTGLDRLLVTVVQEMMWRDRSVTGVNM